MDTERPVTFPRIISPSHTHSHQRDLPDHHKTQGAAETQATLLPFPGTSLSNPTLLHPALRRPHALELPASHQIKAPEDAIRTVQSS